MNPLTAHLAAWYDVLPLALADALASAHRDRQRAIDLARGARELYREQGKGYGDKISEVDAWLARAARRFGDVEGARTARE